MCENMHADKMYAYALHECVQTRVLRLEQLLAQRQRKQLEAKAKREAREAEPEKSAVCVVS
jgi:hypothetical protein